MATATLQQTDYTYQEYLTEWEFLIEAVMNDPQAPAAPPLLTRAEFEANLNSYMSYTQLVGDACAQQRTGKTYHEREQAGRRAKALREQRRPLKLALLIGG